MRTPIGLGVLAVRRCGGLELARELTAGTRCPPSRQNARGQHYFGCERPHRPGYGQFSHLADRVETSDQLNAPTRHALASNPTSSTEWQLGHVERIGRGRGLVGAGLTRGLTVLQALSCVPLAITAVASAILQKHRRQSLVRSPWTPWTPWTPLCTRIFEIGSYRTAVTAKNDNGNARPPRPRP